MKKVDVMLKECVGKLSDDDLEFLHCRFDQRLAGDLSDCLTLLSKVPEVDKWLCSAESADSFFGMVDQVSEQVNRELARRSGNNRRKKEEKEKEVVA